MDSLPGRCNDLNYFFIISLKHQASQQTHLHTITNQSYNSEFKNVWCKEETCKSEQEILKMAYEDGVERTIKYPHLQLQRIVRESSIIQHDHTSNKLTIGK